jgi:hypothetical protein
MSSSTWGGCAKNATTFGSLSSRTAFACSPRRLSSLRVAWSLLAEIGEGVVAAVALHVARRPFLDTGVEVASTRLRQPRREDRLLDPIAERGTRLPGVDGVRVHGWTSCTNDTAAAFGVAAAGIDGARKRLSFAAWD